MLILHLSDIHFKDGVAGSPMDPDHHIRNMLVDDIRKQCERIDATPDAVLVSGDIAFAGAPEEYAFAQFWLEEVCSACGCETSTVFVIPGNHDVDQSVTHRDLIQVLHRDIKATDPVLLPTKLTKYLNDKDCAEHLYASIENYNGFATRYFCDLLPPDRTKIERPFALNDGSTLCITGLNSTFVSSHADERGSLYVDRSVFSITPKNGVVQLVMCHHPYNWLGNGQQVEEHLNSVSQIQLFGHEHTSRVLPARDWFRIAASAAHPDRLEPGWEPGYNLLELTVDGEGAHRKLIVRAHVRIWQKQPGQFVAKMDRQADHFAQSIDLEPWTPPAYSISDEAHQSDSAAGTDHTIAGIEEDASMTSLRALSIRFFKLTYSRKNEIAGRLNLFKEDDRKLPDHERFRRVLLRARKRNQLDTLEAALDEADTSPPPVTTKES